MSSMTYINQQFHNYFVLFFGTIGAPLCTTSFNFPMEKISNEICCIHPSFSFQDSRKLYLILKTFFKKVSDLLAVDVIQSNTKPDNRNTSKEVQQTVKEMDKELPQ